MTAGDGTVIRPLAPGITRARTELAALRAELLDLLVDIDFTGTGPMPRPTRIAGPTETIPGAAVWETSDLQRPGRRARVLLADDGAPCVFVGGLASNSDIDALTPDAAIELGRALLAAGHAARAGQAPRIPSLDSRVGR